jgi:hypothetical protein
MEPAIQAYRDEWKHQFNEKFFKEQRDKQKQMEEELAGKTKREG